MTRILSIAFLVLILAVLATQIYTFWGRSRQAAKVYGSAQAELQRAKADNQKFAADVQYFSLPENISKEMRARFNYRAPDEHLLIIIPENSTSSR